jgi:predicted lysophospholipase L1 biosynthesis ABC-type transport system permease subunit
VVAVGDDELRVVGTAIFPGYAEYPGQDPTDMDDGAWLSIDGLAAVGQQFGGRRVVVDVVDGVDPAQAFADYDAEGLANEEAVEVHDYRPSTVANLERVRTTPLAIALALAVLGGVAAAHALMLSVRRRRPVLAVLRALGFDRRQVAMTVAWQATCIALIAVAVGVPLGIVVGRVSWRALIDQLGGVSPTVVPIPATVAAVVATLVLANVVAAWPARAAARTPAAAVLRAE